MQKIYEPQLSIGACLQHKDFFNQILIIRLIKYRKYETRL